MGALDRKTTISVKSTYKGPNYAPGEVGSELAERGVVAHQVEFERRWLVRQDAPLWPLDQLVLCKQALNPNERSLNMARMYLQAHWGWKMLYHQH